MTNELTIIAASHQHIIACYLSSVHQLLVEFLEVFKIQVFEVSLHFLWMIINKANYKWTTASCSLSACNQMELLSNHEYIQGLYI